MKFAKILAAGAILLAMTGCKTVDIKDGKIPNGYLTQAKKIEGVYTGKFNGVPGELVISIEGDKPVVTYRNSRGGNDILNNNCHSFFGDLQKVYLKGSKNNYQVSGVEFGFNAGACSLMVQGREMEIDIKQSGNSVKLSLSILQDSQMQQVCTWNPGAPPQVPPYQSCTWQQNPRYIYGNFSR